MFVNSTIAAIVMPFIDEVILSVDGVATILIILSKPNLQNRHF